MGECRVTGCNGEICAEFEVSTTCGVTQDWGQCYLLSECTRLENGQCGWTATEIFTRCLYRNGCECSEENDSRTCPGTDFEYGNICFPNGAATECAIQPVRCPEYDDDDFSFSFSSSVVENFGSYFSYFTGATNTLYTASERTERTSLIDTISDVFGSPSPSSGNNSSSSLSIGILPLIFVLSWFFKMLFLF